MTVSELIRQLQDIERDGGGERQVFGFYEDSRYGENHIEIDLSLIHI